MIRIKDRNSLMNMFRPIDQDQVVIPKTFQFPMAVIDYLAWKEPSGHRTFLIFEDKIRSQPLGVAFERTKNSEAVPMMCDWCHAVRPASDVALMTAAVNASKRIGLYICSDISCKDNLLERPSINDTRETLGPQEKLIRLAERMRAFAGKNLV